MKNRFFLLFALILAFTVIFSWFDVETSSSFEMMMGFMSITIGFSVTALSVVASSKFSKTLYGKQGSSNNKTQLHDLIDLFKNANFLFLFNIAIIFIHSWFSNGWLKTLGLVIKEKSWNLGHLFEGLIWAILCVSIFEFYKLFNMFCMYIIQEAQKEK